MDRRSFARKKAEDPPDCKRSPSNGRARFLSDLQIVRHRNRMQELDAFHVKFALLREDLLGEIPRAKEKHVHSSGLHMSRIEDGDV